MSLGFMIMLINFHRSTLFHPVQLKTISEGFFELVCELIKLSSLKIKDITPAITADLKP